MALGFLNVPHKVYDGILRVAWSSDRYKALEEIRNLYNVTERDRLRGVKFIKFRRVQIENSDRTCRVLSAG